MENIFQTSSIQTRVSRGLYEYLLIASPGKDVGKKIMEEKEHFHRQYKAGVVSRPHITVSNFLAKDEMEDTLVRWMQRVISDQKSFNVTLNNYSGFPPHTVFLRVQDPSPFKQLVKGLKIIDSYIKVNNCPPAWFITNPHLSIARRLDSFVYEKAINEYTAKMFNESFMVNELILLRRQHAHDQCKQVAIFPLHPFENFN